MRKILFSFLSLIFIGCSFSKYPVKWKKEGIYKEKNSIEFILGDGSKEVKALYTGSGGVVVHFGEEAILTDPYFSNNPFLRIMLGKIWTRPQFVELGLKRISEEGINHSKIKHVFIAHSHYDHLMDLPYLYQNQLLGDHVKLYGSSSSYYAIRRFLDSDSVFRNIEDNTFKVDSSDSTGRWIKISNQIRVLPIESRHAPHFLNIRLMDGEIGANGIKKFVKTTDKTRAKHWKTGEVFSFLIDYLEEDKIVLRIFIQSSSCAPPFGIPPVSVLRDRKVDIAFIGVASTQNVKDYPKTLLNTLNPDKVVLIHWEDFFRPYFKKPKTVRLTNFNKFFRRVKEVYNHQELSELSRKIVMPRPGTVFYIKF